MSHDDPYNSYDNFRDFDRAARAPFIDGPTHTPERSGRFFSHTPSFYALDKGVRDAAVKLALAACERGSEGMAWAARNWWRGDLDDKIRWPDGFVVRPVYCDHGVVCVSMSTAAWVLGDSVDASGTTTHMDVQWMVDVQNNGHVVATCVPGYRGLKNCSQRSTTHKTIEIWLACQCRDLGSVGEEILPYVDDEMAAMIQDILDDTINAPTRRGLRSDVMRWRLEHAGRMRQWADGVTADVDATKDADDRAECGTGDDGDGMTAGHLDPGP